MTRAQIADPDLVSEAAIRRRRHDPAMHPLQPDVPGPRRPQSDRQLRRRTIFGTRDRGSRLVLCPRAQPRRVVVVGGGVAGLETARVAAIRGHQVALIEREQRVGGMAAVAGPGAELAEWLESECRRVGVEITTATTSIPTGDLIIQCTGSQPGRREYEITDPSMVLDIADVRRGAALPEGAIALFDPIGGPIAVALAEELGDRAILITQDHIAGNELSRTGDLAPANVRLARARRDDRTAVTAAFGPSRRG